MSWGNPHSNPRALVFRYTDGKSSFVLVDDASVFKIEGQTFGIANVESIGLEDPQIAALEADVFGTVVDPGTPVAQWGRVKP